MSGIFFKNEEAAKDGQFEDQALKFQAITDLRLTNVYLISNAREHLARIMKAIYSRLARKWAHAYQNSRELFCQWGEIQAK